MSELHKDLKGRYIFVGRDDPMPRTKVVVGDEEVDEKEDLARREALWLGTLNVKKPENGFNMMCLPNLPDPNRPPFHVAARNYPIPEPPKMFQYPLGLGKNLLRKPSAYTRKPSDEEVEHDRAENERDELVQKFNLLQKSTKTSYGTVQSYIKVLDKITQDLECVEEKLESWKKKYSYIQKKQHEVKQQRQEAIKVEQEVTKKPTEMREENRMLRQKLYNIEAILVNRKNELRKLRALEGDGPCVTEMRQMNMNQKKMDTKIGNLSREREELQLILDRVSRGLSNEISGLIESNQHLFAKGHQEQVETAPTPMAPLLSATADPHGIERFFVNTPSIPPPPPPPITTKIGPTYNQYRRNGTTGHLNNPNHDKNRGDFSTFNIPPPPQFDHNANLIITSPRSSGSEITMMDPQSPTCLAIEKTRIRRVQIQDKFKDLESKVSMSGFQHLIIPPPPARIPLSSLPYTPYENISNVMTMTPAGSSIAGRNKREEELDQRFQLQPAAAMLQFQNSGKSPIEMQFINKNNQGNNNHDDDEMPCEFFLKPRTFNPSRPMSCCLSDLPSSSYHNSKFNC